MPVLPGPVDLTAAQWNYIKSTLQTESQPGGRLNACSWTDANGGAHTAKIVDVRRNTQHFFTDPLDPNVVDPRTAGACGVQLLSWDPTAYASGRKWLITEFEISVIARSVTTTTGGKDLIANGDDALALAWAFVSDGNGNGISNIFRDMTNWTLGGNANKVEFGKGTPKLEPGAGDTPQMWATISILLRAEKPLAG